MEHVRVLINKIINYGAGRKSLRLAAVTLVLLFAQRSFAFNSQNCRTHLPGTVFSLFTSSTEYSSSWGSCSAIGAISKEKRDWFVATTMDRLKVDAAQGGGQYLAALASVYRCDEVGLGRFEKVIQKNYQDIFPNVEDDPAEVNRNLDRVIAADASLKGHCSCLDLSCETL